MKKLLCTILSATLLAASAVPVLAAETMENTGNLPV